MKGFAILMTYWLAGEVLIRLISLPFPGQVAGMILLLASLLCGLVKVESVQKTADFLLSHMMLFFAPIIAGIVVYYPIIAEQWLPAGAALLPGTLAVLAATGWIVHGLDRRHGMQGRKETERNGLE